MSFHGMTVGTSKFTNIPIWKLCQAKPVLASFAGISPTFRSHDYSRNCTRVVRTRSVCRASKGFGSSSSVQDQKNLGDGWYYAANLEEFEEKPTKTSTLSTGKVVVIYSTDGSLYCSDANSTAYDFPLVDAKIIDGPDGPAIECPLDGTTYDLGTGKVIEWCPTNNPLRSFLGMIKSKSEPVDLPMHQVSRDKSGNIYVRMEDA